MSNEGEEGSNFDLANLGALLGGEGAGSDRDPPKPED